MMQLSVVVLSHFEDAEVEAVEVGENPGFVACTACTGLHVAWFGRSGSHDLLAMLASFWSQFDHRKLSGLPPSTDLYGDRVLRCLHGSNRPRRRRLSPVRRATRRALSAVVAVAALVVGRAKLWSHLLPLREWSS